LVVFSRIRVFDGRFIGLVYRFFEASDGFAERFAQFGELAWTENHQGNYKNNDQLRHTKASEHTTPPDEEATTLRFGVRDVNLNDGRGNLAGCLWNSHPILERLIRRLTTFSVMLLKPVLGLLIDSLRAVLMRDTYRKPGRLNASDVALVSCFKESNVSGATTTPRRDRRMPSNLNCD
jgi:hypothetical protein